MMKYRYFAIKLLCAMVMVFGISGCAAGADKPAATEAPNSSVTYEKGADFIGVVKAVDNKGSRITFYNVLLEEEESYAYSGATAIYSKNDRDMSITEISAGEVYEVYTDEAGSAVARMKEYGGITEIEQTKVAIDAEQKRLTVQGVTYAYSDQLVALSNGKAIAPMEITADDEVTFRGVKGQAYSLVVTRGHGYIRPRKYGDFIGGTLTVRGEAILPVSKGMLLLLPEGTQTLTMENGDLTGTAQVEVRRGQVTELDMSRYQSQMPDTARVTFDIDPEGAELYVNGSLTDYSKPVSMKYGKHSIRVILEGYNDYKGIIEIKDAGPTFRINLGEESAEVADEDEEKSDSSVSKEDSGASSAAPIADYDTDHKITVSAPAGAAVYINGTYKGEVPCSFTKMIGNVTLTLSKDGYTTKSYSIQISDDSQDISWSFPELTKESQG